MNDRGYVEIKINSCSVDGTVACAVIGNRAYCCVDLDARPKTRILHVKTAFECRGQCATNVHIFSSKRRVVTSLLHTPNSVLRQCVSRSTGRGGPSTTRVIGYALDLSDCDTREYPWRRVRAWCRGRRSRGLRCWLAQVAWEPVCFTLKSSFLVIFIIKFIIISFCFFSLLSLVASKLLYIF